MTLFVTATSGLNGRIRPTQKAEAVAFWEEGDILHPTGRWSKDYQWIEVESAEWQAVWVHIGYFSEYLVSGYTAVNLNYDKVKIRSRPYDGRVTGYLKKGQEIEIRQVVLGWGKTDRGWIDLYYLEEKDDEP